MFRNDSKFKFIKSDSGNQTIDFIVNVIAFPIHFAMFILLLITTCGVWLIGLILIFATILILKSCVGL